MPSGSVVKYEGARGVVWRIKWRDASGLQVQETVGRDSDGVTRRQAEAVLRDRLSRVDKGYARPKPLTFGDYARTWFEQGCKTAGWKPNTVKVYRNAVDAYLEPAFGHRRLGDLRPRDVSAWVAEVMEKPHGKHKRPLSAKYVNLLVNVGHCVYQSAIADELVDGNPFASVRRPKVIRRKWRLLEPHEVARVLAAFTDERARTVFLTLTLTGLRRFELQALRWRDVSLVERTLRVVESKSEEGERLLALPAGLSDALARLYATTAYKADADYVFAHPRKGSRMDDEWYAAEFRKALAVAGITDYIRPFHDARHGALTNLAAIGTSEAVLMEIAGHRSFATTKQYLHLAGRVFRDSAQGLEDRMLGASVQGSVTNQPETASQSAFG